MKRFCLPILAREIDKKEIEKERKLPSKENETASLYNKGKSERERER